MFMCEASGPTARETGGCQTARETGTPDGCPTTKCGAERGACVWIVTSVASGARVSILNVVPAMPAAFAKSCDRMSAGGMAVAAAREAAQARTAAVFMIVVVLVVVEEEE